MGGKGGQAAVTIPKFGARWFVEATGVVDLAQYHVLVDDVTTYPSKERARPKPGKAQIDQLVRSGVKAWKSHGRSGGAYRADVVTNAEKEENMKEKKKSTGGGGGGGKESATSWYLTFTTPAPSGIHRGLDEAKLSAILRDTVEKWAELPEELTSLGTIFVPPRLSISDGPGSVQIQAR